MFDEVPQRAFILTFEANIFIERRLISNMVWNITVGLWHKYPPIFACETLTVDKRWMDTAMHHGHTINCIGHSLAHIESVNFRGMDFPL